MQDLPDQPLQYLEDELPDDTPKRNILPVIVGSIAVFAAVLALGAYMLFQFLISVPGNIHSNETFVVEPGSPTKLIVQNLKERGLIRSELATLLLLRLQFHNQSLKAGTYIFEAPLSTPAILQYLIAGEPKSDLLRLTFIEGESAVSYGRRAGDVIPDFDTAAFVDQALLYEGRLFPETYLVPKDFTADELLAELLKTFEKNTAALAPAIEASSLSLDEILILASIVEREANTEESMRLVAGILLNRLEIGMATPIRAYSK